MWLVLLDGRLGWVPVARPRAGQQAVLTGFTEARKSLEAPRWTHKGVFIRKISSGRSFSLHQESEYVKWEYRAEYRAQLDKMQDDLVEHLLNILMGERMPANLVDAKTGKCITAAGTVMCRRNVQRLVKRLHRVRQDSCIARHLAAWHAKWKHQRLRQLETCLAELRLEATVRLSELTRCWRQKNLPGAMVPAYLAMCAEPRMPPYLAVSLPAVT
jgi:hypothetical protein